MYAPLSRKSAAQLEEKVKYELGPSFNRIFGITVTAGTISRLAIREPNRITMNQTDGLGGPDSSHSCGMHVLSFAHTSDRS